MVVDRDQHADGENGLRGPPVVRRDAAAACSWMRLWQRLIRPTANWPPLSTWPTVTFDPDPGRTTIGPRSRWRCPSRCPTTRRSSTTVESALRRGEGLAVRPRPQRRQSLWNAMGSTRQLGQGPLQPDAPGRVAATGSGRCRPRHPDIAQVTSGSRVDDGAVYALLSQLSAANDRLAGYAAMSSHWRRAPDESATWDLLDEFGCGAVSIGNPDTASRNAIFRAGHRPGPGAAALQR